MPLTDKAIELLPRSSVGGPHTPARLRSRFCAWVFNSVESPRRVAVNRRSAPTQSAPIAEQQPPQARS